MFGNLICFDATMVTDGCLLALACGAVPKAEGHLRGKTSPSVVPAWPVADTSLAAVPARAGT